MASDRSSKTQNPSLYSRSLGESLQSAQVQPEMPVVRVAALCAALVTVIFLVDYLTPADINIALFYTAAVFVCMGSRSRALLWMVALTSVVLAYLGVILGTPPIALSMSAIWINRSIAAVVLLALASLGHVWIGRVVTAAERHTLIRQLADTFDLAQTIIRGTDGTILFWSRGAQRLYGWSPEEAVGRRSHELLRTRFPEPLSQIEATLAETSRWTGELHHIRKDGETVWVASDWALGPRTDNLSQVVIEVNNEISQLKRAESALLASELRFRRLSESNIVGIVIADFERILEANGEFLKMLGYTRADLDQLTWSAVLAPDHLEQYAESARELREHGASRAVEIEFLDKQGAHVPVLVGSVSINGSFLSFVVDQTERRRLQKHLLQAQKFDSVGKLAGGVAHDFNNLLTIIIGNVELMLLGAAPDDPIRKRLQAVFNAAERAATLTRQLLTFSRHQPEDAQDLEINRIVLGTEPILRQLIREDIRLTLRLGRDAGAIRANSVQMDQVLFNLVVNARDAMPLGGDLVIETESLFVDQEYAASHLGMKPGAYTLLTVSDTGTGMQEHVKEHIFEPFFTTKEPGKGTGIGLATVYAAVTNMGGAISLYSEPGQGTVFKILFPTIGEAAPADGQPKQESEDHAKAATIMVAEDEPALREYIRDVLEHQGFTVLEAENGLKALEVVQGHKGPIDLLLTDLVMPEMGGDELSTRFHELRPQVPILRMSGYSDRSTHAPAAKSQYIQKPFTPRALMASIRALLAP